MKYLPQDVIVTLYVSRVAGSAEFWCTIGNFFVLKYLEGFFCMGVLNTKDM
jgi:hypothetical protein